MYFCSQLPKIYVIMYVCSFRLLTCDCTFVHMITPFLNHELCYYCLNLSGTLTSIWFSLLSLCQDGQHWICTGWCGSMDSRGLSRGGWIPCTLVGRPERLWVHPLPIVLDTWGHDHMPAPSFWSKGEDFRVPDKPCLGRVGVQGTRIEPG
jgi:hypothetical protein